MLLLADQGSQEFLKVQGLHALLPHLYVTGNQPDPSWGTVVFGLVSGTALLLLALLFSFRLTRREHLANWSRGRRVAWRLAVFLAFFACWEVSLQVWAWQDTNEVYLADPVTFWSGRPNDLPGPLTVQRLGGIFDADYPPQREPGGYRILFLGDSKAISIQPYRYGGARTYPKRLAGLDVVASGGQPLETINAAISGYTSWQGLLLLRSLGLKYRPDLVVAAFGYHDSVPVISPDSQIMTDDPRVHLARTILYRSRIFLLLRKIALRADSDKAKRRLEGPRVARVSESEYQSNLRAMVDLGRQNGFRVAVLFEPFRDAHVGESTRSYREAAIRLAREVDLTILDLYTPIAAMTPEQRRVLFDDDIHMTVEGHRLVARLVAEGLEKAGLLQNP